MSHPTSIESGTPKNALPPNTAQKSERTEAIVALTVIQVFYLASLVLSFGFMVLMGFACDSPSNPTCANAQTVINITLTYVIFTIFCCIAAWISFAARKAKLAFVIMLLPVLYICVGQIIATR